MYVFVHNSPASQTPAILSLMVAMQGGGGGFHLLEVNIISAQDLHRATASMSTYATAWIDPDHTLCTRTDTAGGTDPTWNDNLVFTVDEAFLFSATSAVTVDVWAKRYLRRRDSLLGTARILLSTIDPSAPRFAAVMLRRPRSLRPQGILNVGIVLLGPTRADLPAKAAITHKDHIAAGGGGGSRHLRLPLLSSPSFTPVGSENGSAELRERRKSAEEMKGLESKLEQWRSELLPPATAGRRRRMSCFSCCVEEEDVE